MKISSLIENEFAVKNDERLNEQVEKFWKLDSMGILQDEKSVHDDDQQHIELINGRYQVQLPIKEGHPIIEDNYSHCVKRLNLLKQKLNKTPLLLKKYDEVIAKQIKEGIVERVDESEETPEVGRVTYLPHRAVVNEGKSSTKVRVVYDASAKVGDCS